MLQKTLTQNKLLESITATYFISLTTSGLSVLSLMSLIEQICLIVFQEVIHKFRKKNMSEEQLENTSNNGSQSLDADEEERNNAKKVEGTEEPKVVRDYKHTKDFIKHDRIFENNIFNDKGLSQRLKNF